MSEWTDLLPAGVEKPIVLEILHPFKTGALQSGGTPPGIDPRLRADLERLAGDSAFHKSRDKMLQELGADYFSILFVRTEHWRSEQPATGKVDPPGREVHVTVHLPESVARTPQEEASATQAVMNWIDGSELGKSLRRVTQGKISHISARGQRYSSKKDIGQIARREDIQLTIGT